MTPLQFEKNPWEASWWLNLVTPGEAVMVLFIGEGSQLFMGDAQSGGALKSINLCYDPISQKMFGMIDRNQFLVMGANKEAKISDNADCKYTLSEAK
jgi:hypothetical protein